MSVVVLEDESLRDGLQSEEKVLSLEEKRSLFRLLADAGVKRVQVGSFVHPKVVPQMADTDEFISMVKDDYPDVLITGLVLNDKGLERAINSGLKHVSLSVSVSNTHSLKNVRRSSQEALDSMVELIKMAVRSGMRVRAGAQCAFGCVYEGAISEEKVVKTVCAMAETGASELNLADTTGMANPIQIKHLVTKVKDAAPEVPISLHLHDTRGLGLANMMAGYEAGVRIFDVAAGGLGGCPFVKGASGNVPTEDAVHLFDQIGVDTGIDLIALCKVVDKYENLLNKSLPGRMNRVIKSQGSCS
jgi:hydroxymethylglutaryl-CoA lyase